MKKFNILKLALLVGVMGFSLNGFAQYDDLPPIPNEYGRCYAKCKIPDVYETVSTQVLVKEASTKTVTTPAVYETVTEQVLVKEASTELKVIPAVYETVTEQVMVKEASQEIKEVPARYENATERIMVRPASGEWVKKRKGPNCFSENPNDCYIMCWEEIPAEYKTVSKQVLASPGRTDVRDIPAEFKTITKRVLVTPATTTEVVVPAEYKTITKRVLVTPATTEEVVIPAEYKTVDEKRLVSQGGFTRWTEILCAADTTPNRILEVQRALRNLGYDPGPVDGVMGSRTRSALTKYQQDKGLPVGNLNIETLQSLGVSTGSTYSTTTTGTYYDAGSTTIPVGGSVTNQRR